MELLDVDGLAAILKVGRRTIWRWRDAGTIPAPRKISGAVRWVAAEIEEWIRDGCKPCRPLPGAQRVR